jgi:hypothetical protein
LTSGDLVSSDPIDIAEDIGQPLQNRFFGLAWGSIWE